MDDVNVFELKGYHAMWSRFKAEGYTGKAAWEKTEQYYRTQTGGVKRYTSYESFRTIMYRDYKKKT